MPNYSARDMLLKMAEGGEATYGKYGQTAADLLAAEQRILGEIAASPDTWDVATAYNAILESGVTIEDALAAGVQQSTIDAIFTSGAPLPVTSFSTPSTVSSAFESAPYAGQSMEQIRTGAQNYVSGLMADGLTDAERREAQAVATQQGATFQDMLAAGVDPSILFNVSAAKEEPASAPTPFPQTQPEYVPPTVYQPIAPQPDIYAPGEEALDREFRDSAPRTEVTEDVMGTQQLTGFDYTPAAKLLSATGSGFSFTPPSVTSRPRSLMDTGTLNRYTQGRAAQDLRQLTGANYDKYADLLNRTGSYGGGLSRSQLYALTRQQDSQSRADEGEEAADTEAVTYSLTDGFTGLTEGDEESRQSNFTTRGYDNELLARDLGPAGGAIIRPVFAEGGLVKKPEGFADGGSASADLKALGHYKNGGLIDSAIKKGAEALGFDDERQVAISQEAVELTNSMVDAGLIGEQYRVELLMPKEGSERTRQNTGIKGDEEVFNAVNHALFSYDAGQSTVASMGAQAKEVIQGLQKKASGKDPRSEYLDYFNNQFGFNLAKQGLSRQEAKNAIMDTLGNINNQGTRGRMTRGEEVTPGIDLLTNVQDAKYPWE